MIENILLIHKEKSNKMQQCIKILLFHIYMKLNMFQTTHRPSSGAYNCTGSLWFFISGRHTVAHCAWQRPPATRPTTFHKWKTRGCQCSFRLLMIGSVSPETRWASYKYAIIKFWYIVASCWIFLYKLYYDARIHEYQTYSWYSYNGQWNAITDNKPSGHIMKYINPYPANVENMVSSY